MTSPNDVAAPVEATSVDPVPDWRWCLSGGQLAALATAEEYRRTGEIKNPAEFADRIDGLVAALQWAGQRRLSAERREREMAAEKDAAASALEAAEAKVATQAATIAALQAEVERAKEDERDRLYAQVAEADGLTAAIVGAWFASEGAMLPSARSASRKETTS